MDEIVRRAMRSALLLAGVSLLLWAVVPEGRPVAAGIFLGLAAGMLNMLLLKRRVELIGRMLEDKQPRRVSIGLGARLATVAVAAMVALRFPEQFSLPTTLIASFYLSFAVYISALLNSLRESKGKG